MDQRSTHWNGGVSPCFLCDLCLPVNVNRNHWLQRDFLDLMIIKEADDMSWPDQELQLMPFPIEQSLEEKGYHHFL